MENAAEALKMAFGVLMFVMALTLCISSFSQASKAVDSIITSEDRETYVNEYNSIRYDPDPSNPNIGDRIVGVETVVPTLVKAYKENFEVRFFKTDR